MTKVKPDYSFERGGVSLAGWLWQLMGDERAKRERAAEALEAMQDGVPSIHSDMATMEPCPDVEAQMQRS